MLFAPSVEDAARVIGEVDRLRQSAGLAFTPVDIDLAYEFCGLKRPQNLYDERHVLEYRQSRGMDTSFRNGMRACINPWSREVQLDLSLPEERRRMAAAHELMHDYLGHCEIVCLNSPLMSRRAEIEWEARVGAVELVAPGDEFRTHLASLTPAGSRTGLGVIELVASKFKITKYTACRRHVELAREPVAMVSFRLPNYNGARALRRVSVQGYRSTSWDTSSGPTEFLRHQIEVENDPLARMCYIAITEGADSGAVTALGSLAMERYGGDEVEVMITRTSVHVLLNASALN